MINENNVFFDNDEINKIVTDFVSSSASNNRNNYKKFVAEIINATTIVYNTEPKQNLNVYLEESKFFENHK